MNAWHDIAIGDKFPHEFPAIVEVPKDSKIKYELDKDTGLIKVDRILNASSHYPANYGFIPRTYCDDHDPLDILILGQLPIAPLSIVQCRPIGLLKMLDQGHADDKIIAVHIADPEYAHYQELKELPPNKMAELKKFFEEYKTLENKQKT